MMSSISDLQQKGSAETKAEKSRNTNVLFRDMALSHNDSWICRNPPITFVADDPDFPRPVQNISNLRSYLDAPLAHLVGLRFILILAPVPEEFYLCGVPPSIHIFC